MPGSNSRPNVSEGYEVPTELPGSRSGNKSKYSKIILVHVYIIFALLDYSSEVIERLQKLFYGRLINLALEFDAH